MIDFFYDARVPEEVVRAVPDLIVRDFGACPVAVVGPVLWYATPHAADAAHRGRVCAILHRDARPVWAPLGWVCQTHQDYYEICHTTAGGSGWAFARYGDSDWLLAPGNRYREYRESGRTPYRPAPSRA